MKKVLFALLGLFLMLSETQASHLYGGEMSWVCLSNGKFIFRLDVFRECSGIPLQFVNQTITVHGSPLPKRSNNTTLSQIIVKPDSNRWGNNNNGDITPQCPNPNGASLSCANGDAGAIQWFRFESDPIQLKGTPPAGGWTFFWNDFARPSQVVNGPSGAMGLRAKMFRIPNPNGSTPAYLPVDVCQDNSPEFAELPAVQICRGYTFTFNHNAQDFELDSLVYDWDRPLGSSPTTYANFTSPYTYNSPMPDQSFNASNIPSTLNPLTGEMTQAIYNGSGAVAYATVVRVDAWRCGEVIASIYRDIPFLLFDCDLLPGGKKNNPPQILIDGIPLNSYSLEVFAGEKVSIGFQSVEGDLNQNNSPPFQKNTLEPKGFLFSKNYADPNFCETAGIGPCATLTPPPTQSPGEAYKLTNLAGISTQFNWQTDCNHISISTGGLCGGGTGQAGATDGIFNFVMKTYDDHCPIRAINYPTISVKVKAPLPIENPIVKGASIGLDGKTTVNWAPPIDSASTFEEYEIEQATTNNGINPTGYTLAQGGVKNFKQEKTFQYLNFPINIYSPFPAGKDYYLRMRSFSGCSGDVPSDYSEPVRIMELDATTNANKSIVTLNWNRPKPVNAATNSNYVYESQTKFNIYENIEASNNASVTDPSKWTLVGNTYGTTFSKGSPVCNDYVAYRIEALDTVISYAQGSRIDIPNPIYDTLVFSTFSLLDSVLMIAPGSVTAPEIDSLTVLNNGDVFFKVDLASSPIAGRFDFYDVTGGGSVLLGSVNTPNSTFIHSGAGATQANLAVTDYEVVAVNKCNNSDVSSSAILNVITPTGSSVHVGPGDCDSVYRLVWTDPVGMIVNNITYKVFQREVGQGGFSQVAGGLTAKTTDISQLKSESSYEFYVIAENADGDIYISEILTYSVPKKASDERLAPPNVRCVSVLENGDVKVEWTPWDDAIYDTTNIFEGYKFRYRVAGSNNWLPSANGTVPHNLAKTDTEFTFTGLSAQTQQYELEIGLEFYSCAGNVDTSNAFQTIFLDVTANVDKSGDLVWNSTGIAGLNNYEIWRDKDATSGYNKTLQFLSPTENYVDNTNGEACSDIVYYFVRKQDDILGCSSQSNIANDLFQDPGAPEGQLMDYVSISNDGEVEVKWSTRVESDVDSLIFIETAVGGFTPIDKAISFDYPFKRYRFDIAKIDGRTNSVTVGVQAKDKCGKTSVDEDRFDYHTSININTNWNPCDSLVELSWNPYTDFHTGDGVEYEVYWDSTGNILNSNPVGVFTTDTTFEFKIEKDFNLGRDYHFYVRARPTGNGAGSYYSQSNWKSELVIFEGTPRYTYSHYVNVLDENQVELQVYPDASVMNTIGQFVIYRGLYKTELSAIGSVASDDITGPTFRYYDYSAATNEHSYFYRVVAENKCGGPVDTSNDARTIHLKVEADNEALTNTLRWNEYEEWDSTVAFYNIYRSYNSGGFELYEVVPPVEKGEMNSFVDDVYGEITSVGDFCYMVEAIQGPVTTDFGIDQELSPAISRSNEVCVYQEPLFYIPNAFAPKGVNKVFGPQGQFVNWAFYEMIIYNRWGETVYETNDPTKGWDGKVNGKDPQVGSYVYTIRFIDSEGNERRRKGTVTIVQ